MSLDQTYLDEMARRIRAAGAGKNTAASIAYVLAFERWAGGAVFNQPEATLALVQAVHSNTVQIAGVHDALDQLVALQRRAARRPR